MRIAGWARRAATVADGFGLSTRAVAGAVLLAILVASLPEAACAASDYEPPPMLAASDLAPAKLLKGPGFQVDQKVPTDGLLGHFTLRARAGRFEAYGVDMLETRVSELAAIERLQGMSRTKLFTQALGRTAARPVRAAGNMVMHPVDTAKQLPAGVGRFFDRVEAGGARLVAAATDPEKDGEGRAAEVATRTGETTRDALGWEQERRLLAKELKVDPYTTNAVLAKQLDDVAWVSFSARVGVGALMAVVVPGSLALSTTSFANDLVWDTPRGDLVVRNRTAVDALGVKAEQAQAFMQNPAFALSVQTALVEDLQRLSGVGGRAEVIDLAATVSSETQARFIAGAVRFLVRRQENEPLGELGARGTVVAKTRCGALVVPGPVDWVAWTERVARFARREDLAAADRSVWLTGRMSPRAKQEFAALGWAVHEGAR
jgi:hypothetical protein